MTDKDKSKPAEATTYNTNKSYTQLVYGRYIFIAKIAGLAFAILLAIYLILTNIGKSFRTNEKMLTIEQYLSLAEKQRSQFRIKLQLSLLSDLLSYRSDTIIIAINDMKYLLPDKPGAYKYPEERAIYNGMLDALELALKRSLLELQFPFVLTRVLHQDSLKNIDLSGYKKFDTFFPLYITKKIKTFYRITPVSDNPSKKTVDIYLPDSIAVCFNELYNNHTSEKIFDKYVGTGLTGSYKYLSPNEFEKLSNEDQKEQRRAFLALSDEEKNKVRHIEVPVSSELACQAWDEPPGSHFNTLIERKIHELEITPLLSPYYNMATFALVYPMARVYNKNFIASGANLNSVMLVGLKSGRAPSQYTLERKDCPKILKLGMYADITDVIEGWDQVKRFPKFPFRAVTYKDRVYGIPSGVLTTDCIEYRRDWLEEPGIVEWFKKKGWIHPVDGRPYIPLEWTYDDFRVISKLISDNDPTKKRKGFVDRPGPMMYLDANSIFHIAFISHYYKPNPTQATTWIFDKENPVYREGMKTVHDMFWFDKSIRTGVEINYTSAQEDFNGGRVGMAYIVSTGVLYNALMKKYTIFGKQRPYSEIVGLTGIPGCNNFPNLNPGDCKMLGFNPNLNRDQLKLAVEWVKKRSYGDFVNNSMFYEVKEAKTLGGESILYRNAISSIYDMDYKQFNIDFRSVFNPIYLEFYDNLREAQKYPPPPQMEQYGLTEPLTRMVSEQIETMFQKVQMDSLPDYNRILTETANYINTTLLNFKDENSLEKIKRMYDDTEKHFAKYLPEYLPFLKAENQRKKIW